MHDDRIMHDDGIMRDDRIMPRKGPEDSPDADEQHLDRCFNTPSMCL